MLLLRVLDDDSALNPVPGSGLHDADVALALSLQRSQTSLLPQSHLGQIPLQQFNNNGGGGLGARADNSSLENLSQQNYDASSAVVINPNQTSTLLTASHMNLQT